MTTVKKNPGYKTPVKKSCKDIAIKLLEELPSPFREMAIYNVNKQNEPQEPGLKTAYGAITGSFDWDKTEQGAVFWEAVADSLHCGVGYPEIPDFSRMEILKGFLPDYDIKLDKKIGLQAGCQKMSPEKAVQLATAIYNFFGE